MTAPIRWGFLGTSGIAQERFIPAVHAARNSVPELIAGRDSAKASDIASKLGVRRVAPTYAKLIADPNIDAVYVSLPNTHHATWVVRALEAGKPVLCEKPLAVTLDEALEIERVSMKTGMPVMEGLMYRFHPQNEYVRDQIGSGAIGEVREVRVDFSFPLIGMVDPHNIRITDGPGGGAIMDVGCYVVSAARMLFGQEPLDAIGWVDRDIPYGIDVGFAGALRFLDNRFASVSWSLRTGYGAGYTVVGSEKSLEVPRAFIPGAAGQLEETLVIETDKTTARTEQKFQPTDHFALMIERFADALIVGSPLPYDASDAVKNAAALELVRQRGMQLR